MENLRELICAFLKVNPEPSDAQFHSLAEAAGVDKEELESIAYEMLAEADELIDPEVDATEVLSDANLALEGEIGPNNMPLTDLALNDGDPTADDQGMQEETDDDGADVHDLGVGLSVGDTPDVLQDDGVPNGGIA